MPHKGHAQNYQHLSALNNANHRQNVARVQRARSGASVSPAPAPAPAPAPKDKKDKKPPTPQTVVVSSGYGGGNSNNSSGLVLIILLVLFTIMVWGPVVKPLTDLIWNTGSKNDITTLPWKSVLGMIVFIVLAVAIAGINEDLAGLMIIISVGILIVYLIEQGGGGVSAFFNWLVPPPPKGTTTGPTQHAPGAGPQK